jgi:hypothetical protein
VNLIHLSKGFFFQLGFPGLDPGSAMNFVYQGMGLVARLVNGKNIREMVHYNENNVAAGEARLLLASCFVAV